MRWLLPLALGIALVTSSTAEATPSLTDIRTTSQVPARRPRRTSIRFLRRRNSAVTSAEERSFANFGAASKHAAARPLAAIFAFADATPASAPTAVTTCTGLSALEDRFLHAGISPTGSTRTPARYFIWSIGRGRQSPVHP
jgi:hypothetical protein